MQVVAKLLGADISTALASDAAGVANALQELRAEDLAEMVGALTDEEIAQLATLLPVESAANVLCRLTREQAGRALGQLEDQRATLLLRAMAPDDRADLVQSLPPESAERLLNLLGTREPTLVAETRALASYGEDTAGGIMTTVFVAFGPELTVGQALERVRQVGRERNLEVVYYAYVVAYERLVGVVSLRDLLLHNDDELISDVMTASVVHVHASVDQEEVAQTAAKYGFAALPVVDDDGRLLGIVTIDDMIEVIQEEATEDAQKMAGLVPIENERYFDIGFRAFVRSRVTWLAVLFLGEMLTASVMHQYESQIALALDLVVFIPLIISSGGNSGSQSSSLIIRALAVGEMSPADWARVLVKEAGIGLTLGALLGGIGFARVLLFTPGHTAYVMAFTVAFAIVSVVTMGTLIGSLMPLAIKRLGLDPAVSSTPFVASLVDVLGLFVYFNVARMLFAFML